MPTPKPHYDDIVVGSGLSALGTVHGLLERTRRVLVIAGNRDATLRHYGFAPSVPCANLGQGGLGQFWHGVIPLNVSTRVGYDLNSYRTYLTRFYPSLSRANLTEDTLFVPWKPIRPSTHLANLISRHPSLTILPERAGNLQLDEGRVEVVTPSGKYTARTGWVAAGALDTPALLSSVLGNAQAQTVSDHIIGYAGKLEATPELLKKLETVDRLKEGVSFPCFYNAERTVLYTLRPARFDFATLDEGIEKRAVFGLPTSKAIAGILGRVSPGLVAEAIYNKTGLFKRAGHYSIYFQAVAKDVYARSEDGQISSQNTEVLANATQHARETVPFEGVALSQRPELLIPGIHLHDSLSSKQKLQLRNNPELSQHIRVVDPSSLSDIGPEHHSFRMMFDAYQQARRQK